MTVWFLFAAMCLVVLVCALAYMQLAAMKRRLNTSCQKLDQTLRYRAELIPPLTSAAQSLPSLETDVLSRLNALAKQYPATTSRQQRAEQEEQIPKGFKKIFTVAQETPELQQNIPFSQLQNSIIHAEKKLRRAKRLYNTSAEHFNRVIAVIPLSFIAQICEIQPCELFETSSAPRA